MSLSSTSVGIGLRHPHYQGLLETRPALGFVEVHSENFFHAGGASLHFLERVRETYPISLHGVGLSLGSADATTRRSSHEHLKKLKQLVDHIQPTLVSEHLCWGAIDDTHFNDLLPLPYTVAALDLLSARIHHVQDTLQRTILIENLSAYLQFQHSDMDEFEFLAALSQRTGCGILLDVNNLYVNACNFSYDPWPLLQKLPRAAIGEIHLAGHTRTHECLIDTHSTTVCSDVWQLYQRALNHIGAVPTLIEWDTDIPPLDTLLQQAAIARKYLEQASLHAPTVVMDAPAALVFSLPATAPQPKNSSAVDLHRTQTHFGAALLHTQHVAAATPLFSQAPEIAQERLAIYRGNVVTAITHALQAAYPVIERIVGTEFFLPLARAYWQAAPSQDGDLHAYGASFASFLNTFPHTQGLPYLPDVARLEWNVHRAYSAPDQPSLALSALAQVAPEAIGNLTFVFTEASALLTSPYPIARIWQQHQPTYPDEIEIDLTQSEAALVHRVADKTGVVRLDADQYFFLHRLCSGDNLGAALDATLEHYSEFVVDQTLTLAFHHATITLLKEPAHDTTLDPQIWYEANL